MNTQIEKYHSRLNGAFITKTFLTLVVVLIFFILPLLAYSADLTLAWDANNEPDLAGYKLHYGTSSGNYSNHVDVGTTLQHTFTGLNAGVTYYFAATAYDTQNNQSGYSQEISYTIPAQNSAPDTPAIPSGPTSGLTQTGYSYSTYGTDPDDDILVYRFDWGDGQISNWGMSSQTHSWGAEGNFCVKAQARDELDAVSGWSACRTVSISVPAQNHSPNTPAQPAGPTSGSTLSSYTFSTSATDPDGDPLEFSFDWGDGAVSSWGASSRSHAWSSAGTYCVKARARDTDLATSEWSGCRSLTIAATSTTYTITATAEAHGKISPTGSVVVNHGDNLSFTITPYSSYHVADVVVDGASVGAVSTYTFNSVSANHSISASFAYDNRPPVANAGPDQTVNEGSGVSLNGSNSYDPVGSIAGYYWEQTAGKSVSLLNPHSQTAAFTAPAVSFSGESLTFRLTVTDTGGLTDMDYCTIYVNKADISDSDGDGVPDDQDAFPYDPKEWLDSDGDGSGNNADTDDDNDGMPDVWEEQYGLDPLVDDAGEDPDGDGISNIDEYIARTDPTQNDYNDAPDAPLVLTPQNNDLVSLVPTIQTDQFYDPNPGDSHLKTQWQIFDELSTACVYDIETSTSLTAIKVPRLVLDENTTYYCRARYFDNHGTPSAWSESIVFATDFNAGDSNGNGIPDLQELTQSTDMDKDRVPDEQQDDIKCLSTADGQKFLGLSIKGSATVTAIDSVFSEGTEESLVASSATGKPNQLPFGLLGYKLRVHQPGDAAEITIYFSERWPTKDATWYMYDPIEDSWFDFSDYAQFNPNQKSVTISIADGGIADADGIANGIIVDPAGIGVTSASSDSGSNEESLSDQINDMLNISCFISTAALQTSSAESKNLWNEIRGRELAIIFIALVLIYAGKLAVYRIRIMRNHIR